ncbi:MAG: hypothetical protein OEY36_11815 [Gammaproteobacteria bacterium]|nr:hypothetical protein [Gammaproteobacteria bacterium]
MQHSVDLKYLILFVILIALTGFSIESQSDQLSNSQLSAISSGISDSRYPTLNKH